MRCGLFLLLAACDPSVGEMQIDAAVPDAETSPDSVAMIPACPSTAALSVCVPFDADPLTSPTPNYGTVMVDAILTNVTRTADPNGGGAALLDATSEVSFPSNSAITGIVQLDATVRLDADVPPAGRVGVLDSEITSVGMSMFIYAGTTTPHRVRCNIGGVDVYGDTTLALGAWVDLTCTCESGTAAVEVDGVKLAELAGCEPGDATTGGMQIGQNSRARDGLPPNEPLIGAIDSVRLWTAVQ